MTLRDMGLVAQVFNEERLRGLGGEAAIGHCRYSTTGSTHWANAQPIVQHGKVRSVALGHNGNLTNTEQLREQLRERGVRFDSTSDTEVIAALIAHDDRPLEEAVAATMAEIRGAFSAVVLSEGKLVGFRDPNGIRPLALRPLDEVLEGLQMAVLDPRDGEVRHDRLDPRPHLEDLLEIAERDLAHEGPATRDNLDQPVMGQGMERIPQGGSPNSEPLRQVTLHQCHPGFQICPQDEVPEGSVRGGRVRVDDRTFLSTEPPRLPIRAEYL